MGIMKRMMDKSQGKSLKTLPFDMFLPDITEIEREIRVKDEEKAKSFNKDVTNWAKNVNKQLKSSIRSNIKRDLFLSKSLKYNVRKYEGETGSVGFAFERQGVYAFYGAGKGKGGQTGSTWINKKGERKSTDDKSLGLMGTGNRKPKDWFDSVINSEIQSLINIIANYSADLQIDTTRIFINREN